MCRWAREQAVQRQAVATVKRQAVAAVDTARAELKVVRSQRAAQRAARKARRRATVLLKKRLTQWR